MPQKPPPPTYRVKVYLPSETIKGVTYTRWTYMISLKRVLVATTQKSPEERTMNQYRYYGRYCNYEDLTLNELDACVSNSEAVFFDDYTVFRRIHNGPKNIPNE